MSLLAGFTLLVLGLVFVVLGTVCAYAIGTAEKGGRIERIFFSLYGREDATPPITAKRIQEAFASAAFVGLLLLSGSFYFFLGRIIAPNDLALFAFAVGLWSTFTCFIVWASALYAPDRDALGKEKSLERRGALLMATGAGFIGLIAFFLVGGPWLAGGILFLCLVLFGLLRNYNALTKLASPHNSRHTNVSSR